MNKINLLQKFSVFSEEGLPLVGERLDLPASFPDTAKKQFRIFGLTEINSEAKGAISTVSNNVLNVQECDASKAQ